MDESSLSRSDRRAVLVIAHPGHELLVHGWLETARPIVFVLASGNGPEDDDAIVNTAKIVKRAGAKRGGIFGRYTDRGLHQAMMLGEKDRFNSLVQELADVFLNESIELVAGDAAEGIDPSHDLCRLLIDAAVALAAQIKPTLRNFEIPLFGTRTGLASDLRQRVEGEAWCRKFASCRSYAEPIEEIQHWLGTDGIEVLREERLRLAVPWSIQNRNDVRYTRSNRGRIPTVQFQNHFLPVAGSMQRFAKGRHSTAA
ncbi:MAG: hypothetical protein K8T89_26235 [Planctomycetes bacterium]|nr:hypothetical protein [Planctomycetota bacterium]